MPPATTPKERYRDGVSGADVLVGEMLAWSDEEVVGDPAVVREVVRSLASTQPRRVLLAGPRAMRVVDALPDRTRVEFLLRSLPDTRHAADVAGLHDGVRLHAGGADAFTPERPFDLVVALGGPGRLLGPDSRGMTHAELLERLASWVADGGTLVTDVANGLGLDTVAEAAPVVPDDRDDLWYVGAAGFDRRPPYRHELEAALDGAGLRVATTYAALPDRDHSSLLVDLSGASRDADPATREQVRAHACRAMARASRTTPMLREPRALTEGVVEAGLLADLAPAWLLVARKGEGEHPALPRLVDADPQGDRWSHVVTVDADGTTRTAWADGHPDDVTREGILSRDLSTRRGSGRLLDLVLREAAAQRNHGRLREVLNAYAAWLSDEQSWQQEGVARRPFAVPSNVVVSPDGSFALFDRSWQRTGPLHADRVLFRGLRDWSRSLLASAAAHPWRSDSTPDSLTTTLAAMTGRVATHADLVAVAEIEARITALREDRAADYEEILADDLESGQFARDLPAASATGFRELLLRDRVQNRRMRERDGQVAWLEGTLRLRDRYVRELEQVIERYEETLTYKTVQVIRAPRRIATEKAVGAAKSTVKDALPPDFVNRARRAARRVLKEK